MTTPEGLARVIAQHEIADLSYRYARGSDRLDAGIFASAFWDDGAFNQLVSEKPIPAVAAELVEVMRKNFALTHHLIGNILVDFTDADHATAEVYFRVFHLTRPGATREDLLFLFGERRLAELSHIDGNVYDIVGGGRYLDRIERRDGIWKIKTRLLIFDYCTVQPSATLRPGEGLTALGAAKTDCDKIQGLSTI